MDLIQKEIEEILNKSPYGREILRLSRVGKDFEESLRKAGTVLESMRKKEERYEEAF